MATISIRVDDDVRDQLETYARARGSSLSDLLRLAIDTHLITSHHALPLLVRNPGGLVVEVTDGTAEYNADHYRVNAFYDLAKTGVIRLAWGQAQELEEHGGTAVVAIRGHINAGTAPLIPSAPSPQLLTALCRMSASEMPAPVDAVRTIRPEACHENRAAFTLPRVRRPLRFDGAPA